MPGSASSEVERSLCKSFFTGNPSSNPAKGCQEVFLQVNLLCIKRNPDSSKYATRIERNLLEANCRYRSLSERVKNNIT